MKLARETGVGIFVVLGLLCVAYLTIKLGRMEVFDSSGYTVTARFSSVTGLRQGAGVEIAGVQVGRVAAIRLDPATFMADVDLRLNEGLELGDDAIASIKTSGLIGDKYVSIAPGGSTTMLEDGDTIFDTEPVMDLMDLIGKVIGNIAFGGV